MRYILIFLTSFLGVEMSAQPKIVVNNGEERREIEADVTKACNPEQVYWVVSGMPKYIKGNEVLEDELNSHLEISRSLKGEINLLFTINCDGLAYGFQVIEGLGPEFDSLLILFLEERQGWIRGTQSDEEVDCVKVLTLRVKKGKLKING